MLEEKKLELKIVAESEKLSVSVSREELLEMAESLEAMTLQCQRMLHRLQRLSLKFTEEN